MLKIEKEEFSNACFIDGGDKYTRIGGNFEDIVLLLSTYEDKQPDEKKLEMINEVRNYHSSLLFF
jgi:hypothetical protein